MRRLDLDIETIVGKALEKEADRRYASASALSEDITRWLTSQPILARPPSTLYQLGKFARRNTALVGGVVAVFVMLAGGVVVSTSLYLRSEGLRRDANLARNEAEQARQAEAEQRDFTESERDRARRQAYVANIVAAGAALSTNETVTMRQRLDAAPLVLRNWEWKYPPPGRPGGLNEFAAGRHSVFIGR